MKFKLVFIFLLPLYGFAQIKKNLEVISICEYKDYVKIIAVDSSLVSYNIYTITNEEPSTETLKPLIVSVRYDFILTRYESYQAQDPNFAFRMKGNIIWRPTDGLEKYPYFTLNVFGRYILNE